MKIKNISSDKKGSGLYIVLIIVLLVFIVIFALVITSISYGPAVKKSISSNGDCAPGDLSCIKKAVSGNNINSSSNKCKDSDSGQDFIVLGVVVNSSGASFRDFCKSEKLLNEYYCEDENIKSVEKKCDYSCFSGRCSSIPLINAKASYLPRIDYISSDAMFNVPGSTVTIIGEGFSAVEENLIIFKLISSPLSFYNEKAGIEYRLEPLVRSINGKSIQITIPGKIYELASTINGPSGDIPVVPGRYEIIVVNTTSDYSSKGKDGIIRSNPGILIINETVKPSKIEFTSPKEDEIYNIKELKRVSWNPVPGVKTAELYLYTRDYRIDENNTGFYFQRIQSALNQSKGYFDWNVGIGELRKTRIGSPEEAQYIPWIPPDGKLEAHLILQGKNDKGMIYKDMSSNFKIQTDIIGNCNECPGEMSQCINGGYRLCTKFYGCFKWQPVVNCSKGLVCVNGACR